MMITREKIAALFAVAGCLLMFKFPRLGAMCMIACFLATLSGVR
jgi:hypothetical protein